VLVPGCVGFCQEGQGIIYSSQLSGLTYLPFVGFAGTLEDALPNVRGQGLVRICCARQLAAYPFFRYFLVSIGSVIYVPSSFCHGLVGLIIVEEISGVNGFVVGEVVFEQIEEFILIEVGWLVQFCAVPPLLCIPVVRRTVNFGCWFWTVGELVPRFEIGYFGVD